MQKIRKNVIIALFLLSAVVVLAGCGNVDHMQENTSVSEKTEPGTENISTEKKGDRKEEIGEEVDESAGEIGDAAKDVADEAGDVVDDVADGVGDAIDNLGGGSFDTYDDAREYLLRKLKKDNEGASYEVREEKKDIIAYNTNDSGAEGYQFSVYETDGGEKIGIYYVDKDSGKIYRYMGKNSIEAY